MNADLHMADDLKNTGRACWKSPQNEPRCHRARKMVTSEISFQFYLTFFQQSAWILSLQMP
jgi:hypothetical protein